MHVKTSSNVADHCFIHALSQAGSISFEQECSHDHTHQCIQCNQLDETLASILKMANDMEWDNPEAYLFKVCTIHFHIPIIIMYNYFEKQIIYFSLFKYKTTRDHE